MNLKLLTPRRLPRGRRLVVVDLENIVGGLVLDGAAAAWARRELERTLQLCERDLVVIGSCRWSLLAAGSGWPGARHVMRSGPDGADLALLDVLEEDVADRFDRVAIVSGDHIFLDSVAALQRKGVHVTVTGVRGHISRRLAMMAHETVHLETAYNGICLDGKAIA